MSRYRRSFVCGGTFFFTLTLAEPSATLITDHIERLKLAYSKTKAQYPFSTLAYCCLPNHLHVLWTLPENDKNYAIRWQLIKRRFSTALPENFHRSESKIKKREKGIWQRRYWEHQIRDESDLIRHIDYIHINPMKHGLVQRVKDWPYSSFHHYVEQGSLPFDWAGEFNKEGCFGE